jgi:Domain of unknown function (DUF4124)
MVRSPALRLVTAGAVACLALLALPAEAQWKWRDPSGHVQYSDLPPPLGTPDKDILARPAAQQRAAAAQPASAASAPSVAASAALAPRMEDPGLEAARKQVEADKAAKAKADADKNTAIKADNCTRAKSQAASLDSGVRLVRTNKDGEREYLDDDQRAAESKRVQGIISANCS